MMNMLKMMEWNMNADCDDMNVKTGLGQKEKELNKTKD